MVRNSLLNSERYLFLSRARLVADNDDSCGLAVVSYYTCNWQNNGINKRTYGSRGYEGTKPLHSFRM